MKPEPGPIRRMKTYTGATGYVYQYYFVGRRPAPPPEGGNRVYLRRHRGPQDHVFHQRIPQAGALGAWFAEHGRELTETEQYAAAKMRLLRAFDEMEGMIEHGRRLVIDGENIEELLAPLGMGDRVIGRSGDLEMRLVQWPLGHGPV